MTSQRSREARDRELLEVSVQAARRAAQLIADRGRVAEDEWRVKAHADFVSEVDTQAEEVIRETLMLRVPGATIIGEELSPRESVSTDVAFIVDPVDGTTNFLHGYPAYAVSIAAVEGGELAAGVILDVPRNELFTAQRGTGAFLDGRRIHVSTLKDPTRALLGTGFPFKHPEMLGVYQEQFARILRASAGIRRAGSAALDLANVACGRFDGFWELWLAPWDMAAGMLLVREAGGMVTDMSGREIEPYRGEVVASNSAIHEWLVSQLDQRPESRV